MNLNLYILKSGKHPRLILRDTLELLFSFMDTHGVLLIHILPKMWPFMYRIVKNLTPLYIELHMALSKRESRKIKACKDIKMIWLILQWHHTDILVNAKLNSRIPECQDVDNQPSSSPGAAMSIKRTGPSAWWRQDLTGGWISDLTLPLLRWKMCLNWSPQSFKKLETRTCSVWN